MTSNRMVRLACGWAVIACLALVGMQPVLAQPPQQSFNPGSLGVSINLPSAYQGYTLVSPMNLTTTYLIDMEGRVVNQWESEYTPAMCAYLLPNGHLLRPGASRTRGFSGPGGGGHIQEFDWDGNLVWHYTFPDGKIQPHHDISPMPNGNVLVVCWDKKTPEEAIAAGRLPTFAGENEFLPDCILEIKPTGGTTGQVVWKWHAWDHIIQDVHPDLANYGEVFEHPELIDINFGSGAIAELLNDPEELARLRTLGYVASGVVQTDDRDSEDDGDDDADGPGDRRGPQMQGDWMHTNSIAYNPQLDQIMLSIHEFSEVWIIDHSTTTEEAASHEGGRCGRGGDLLYRWGNPRAYRSGSNVDQRLFGQHCAHWIPEGLPGAGNMLVFNNGMQRPDGQYSSVDEVVLPVNDDGTYFREEFLAFGPERATWSYSAPEGTTFFSMLISGAQRLPNGNTLICSGNPGTLFEVSANQETVWNYQHPMSGNGAPGPGGFGPGGFTPPRPGELFPSLVDGALQITDEQRESIQPLQDEVFAKLDEVLTEAQREQLRQPFQFGPGGGGPRGQGPRGQGPDGPQGPPPDGQPGGPGPRRFAMPRVGEVLPEFLRRNLDLSDDQIAAIDELQEHVDGELETVLTEAQHDQIEQWQQAFAGGFGPPGGGPPPDGQQGPPDGPQGPPPGGDNQPGGNGPPGGFARRVGPGGPGGPGGGGPGGLFRVYRYGMDYPGLEGKDLTPGELITDILASNGLGPNQGGPARPQPESNRPESEDE